MTFKARRHLASPLLALTLSTACVALPSPGKNIAAPAENSAATVHPEIWPRAEWPYPEDASVEARIDAIIAHMTIEEKVGQVIQADIGAIILVRF